MKKVLLLLYLVLLFSCQQKVGQEETTKTLTPEGVGKHISEQLINRADIIKSHATFPLNRLLSERIDTLSVEDRDNPAGFVILMFAGEQALLFQNWSSLLFCADSLNITSDAKHLKTLFSQTADEDKFTLAHILELDSSVYTFYSEVRKWEDAFYLMKVEDELKKYDNLEECEKEYLFKSFNFDIEPKDDLVEYAYNESYAPKEIEDVSVNFEPFVAKLTEAVNKSSKSGVKKLLLSKKEYKKHLSSIVKDNAELSVEGEINDSILAENEKVLADPDLFYEKYLTKTWDNLIELLPKNGDDNITVQSVSLSNIAYWYYFCYHVMITYELEIDSKKYDFTCAVIFIDGQWKLMNTSPLREEVVINFQF